MNEVRLGFNRLQFLNGLPEPIFSVGADAYYLEDMNHVTVTGVEVLSAGLPYTAQEIEAAMRSR